MALLLPQSGSYATFADAVVDGFVAAWFAVPAPRPEFHVYDTAGDEEALRRAYDEALAQDPAIVIGPLLKESVAALARTGAPPVPVLALNFLGREDAAPDRFYQIGLSPEDEARQAADSAAAHGLRSAVALTTDDPRGARLLAAFRDRFEEIGGTVLASTTYARDGADYAGPIRDLLAITASQNRAQTLAAVLGRSVRFEPRRRQDVDVIFVTGGPDDARMILPQLRFHRAEDLPVYATAAAYDRRVQEGNRDGLRFCDVPLLIAAEPAAEVARAALALFPDRDLDHARLFALGYDVHGIAASLAQDPVEPGDRRGGVAGWFMAGADRIFHRRLACSQVVSGSLVRLDEPAPQR
jgi:outer membrane PBP1 activator LpoA protein